MISSRTTSPAPARFWWRGALILLPVAVLAAAGLWQLRHDRHAALQKAREQAEADARRLTGFGATALQSKGRVVTEIDADRRPVDLVFYDSPPQPSEAGEDAEELQRIRRSIENARSRVEQARALAVRAKGNTGSGLPVAPLAARLALVTLAEADGTEFPNKEVETLSYLLCRTALEQPSVLTESLLTEAESHAPPSATKIWELEWRAQELLRAYFVACGGRAQHFEWQQIDREPFDQFARFIDPSDASDWLGDGQPEVFANASADGNLRLAFQIDVKHALRQATEDVGVDPYVRVCWKVGGRWLDTPAKDQETLASANHASLPLEIVVQLAEPDLLLADQRKRTRQMALIIGLASLAAGVGWWTSWRAFRVQVALAKQKDNFASSVSHELRAPIASIRIMAESLESGRAEGEGKRHQYAQMIAGECARLGSLVENVLAFSRLESGRDAFEFEDGDARAVLGAAVDLMRPAAAEREMRLEIENEAGEMGVSMDAGWVGRALVNLLDNALKYGPAGTEVAAAVEPGKTGGVVFSVADSGDPLPASERERIFDRFYRRGSELTRETQGVGIGLSLVRHIAEAHGGRAWVESWDSGNRFFIEIPNAE